ncbi:hypothetical protein GGTG_01170 [Gaeumannomyces tritici R3-111a-1]|uniref:Uncharacterized protein n=1 Tax=Gaeumannomyces tritici (strain R3-111a-1) TaxID=644352 RepID=J3NIT6_GAET3|nr:hypothetical protein GGTG_01170 [Gaeumannomyces tritici R3-111a-1]EJT81186.1 hypothetical protein GGTG_01170 [Gaeumannomyces tritici R3-111a-1]
MVANEDNDSPLSIAANVAGILTFVVAILAAAYVRVTYLRNSDAEYFRVKASLSWYKTESTWLTDLVRAAADLDGPGRGRRYSITAEFQMYTFVMEDLVRLEQRLLELVKETEERATADDDTSDAGDEKGRGAHVNPRDGWTFVPKRWTWNWTKISVATAWLSVRTKALELVRQRDALTARVLFTQMSMVASRIRELESRTNWREVKATESFKKLEDMITSQQGEIRRLEDLVYRIMHKRRVGGVDQVPMASDPSPSAPLSPVEPTSPLSGHRASSSSSEAADPDDPLSTRRLPRTFRGSPTRRSRSR